MAYPEKWQKLDDQSLAEALSIVDIAKTTGLSRRAVRDMIDRYEVPPLPRSRPHHPYRYLRTDMIKAVNGMAGSGNWPRKTQPPKDTP